MKITALWVAAAILAAAPAFSETLASVGKEKITVEEFQKAVALEERNINAKLNAQQKKAVLQAMVNQRLLVAEARSRKLHKKDPVKSLLLQRERDLLSQAVYELEVLPKTQTSAEEVRAFYDRNPQVFDVARVRQILVRPLSPEKKDAARKEAERLKRKATRKNFAELAKSESDDQLSRDNGGDLGLLRRGTLLPVLEEAVFSAKKGAFLGPIESQFGFHVMYVEDRRQQDFKEAGPLIFREFQRNRGAEAQAALLKSLEKKHKIKIKEDKIP